MTRHLGRNLRFLFLVVAAVIALYPLVWMFWNAFRPGADIMSDPLGLSLGHLTTRNFAKVWDSVPLVTGFRNTAIVVAGKVLLTMLFCPLVAYGFAKYEFPGRRVLFSIVLGTLLVPGMVFLVPMLTQMAQLGWVNTFQALILPGSVDAFSVFWMRQVIASIPDGLLDAGRADGCSEFGLYWRIVVPCIRPGLAALAVLSFINVYNDFVWPVVVTNDTEHATLQVMLSTLGQSISSSQVGAGVDSVWGQVVAGSAIASIPILLFFILMQRYFINGLLGSSGLN